MLSLWAVNDPAGSLASAELLRVSMFVEPWKESKFFGINTRLQLNENHLGGLQCNQANTVKDKIIIPFDLTQHVNLIISIRFLFCFSVSSHQLKALNCYQRDAS